MTTVIRVRCIGSFNYHRTQRGYGLEFEASFMEPLTVVRRMFDWVALESWWLCDGDEVRDSVLLCAKNAGFEGAGRVIEWLVSITRIEFMVGLSAGLSWTHNNAMWIMPLIISLVGHILLKFVPSIQCFMPAFYILILLHALNKDKK